MPGSAGLPKKSGEHVFQPDPLPPQVHAKLFQHGHHLHEENLQGCESAEDLYLEPDAKPSRTILKGPVTPSFPPQGSDQPSLPIPSAVRAAVFGCGKEVIATVRDRLVAATHMRSHADLVGLPSHLVATPELPELPVTLRPWATTLRGWGKTTGSARKRPPFGEEQWMKEHEVTISGPVLPEGYCPWFVSAGVDPGPQKTDLGHTCLLLVAAPEDWFPDLLGVLHGPFGEQLVVRLDSLLMKVTTPWWDAFAYGALATGALYFIAPQPSD